MSWIEKINSGFIIVTGDGKTYNPNWMNANISVEYNVAEFDFPAITGTLVTRTTSKGAKYNIEIFFQGEDCLDLAKEFRTSADDKRAWNVSHPLYGDIIVQPLGLSFDDTKFNVSKVTGTIVETITEEAPKGSTDPVDKIAQDKENLDAVFEESFSSTVVPDTKDKASLTDNMFQSYSKSLGKIKDGLQSEEYFNAFNTANAFIINATEEPLEAIRAAQTFLSAPALFADTVQNRVNLLTSQFNRLRESVVNATTYALKKIYENNAGILIGSMAVATSTPLDKNDYGNRDAVIAITEALLENYNNFVADLNGLQSLNGGTVGAYIPDSYSLISLGNLIGFTVSNLFDIALNAKQERSIILEDDNNIIVLTHRFYSLLPDDSTISEFMRNNNIGLNEMLQIKKGRKIIYYV